MTTLGYADGDGHDTGVSYIEIAEFLMRHGLSLSISEKDNSLDLDLALSVAEIFRVEKARAHEIIARKAITGQRRVGKSYILRKIRDEIIRLYPKSNILYLDKEKHEFESVSTHTDLIQWAKSNTKKGKNYLFIDEVQEIKDSMEACHTLYICPKKTK